MDIYTEDDFDENNPVTKANYADVPEEDKYEKFEISDEKEEFEDEDYDEDDESDLDHTTLVQVLSNSSTESRCSILQEEIRLLKLENDLLLSREKSLKDRLELLGNDNETLNTKVLEYEVKVSSLNKEIDLVKCRSEARQSTLENNYRELCSKIAASEELNQKMRFDLNQQRAKNTVLEELVENKNTAIAELERRMEHLAPSSQITVKLNGEVQSDDKYKDLKYRLHATERQLDQVVTELSKVVSHNTSLNNDANSKTSTKYLDYRALIKDYNQKSLRVKELEERLSSDENKSKIATLEDSIKILNEKLATRSNALKETERELKEFYSKQLDDLRTNISEHKQMIDSKVQELNTYRDRIESMKMELDLKNKSIIDKNEALNREKSQNHEIFLENESLKRKINEYMDQIRSLKLENQVLLDREATHIAEFKNYSNETDLKLKKMELVLRHTQQMNNKPNSTQNDETDKKDYSEFKNQLLEEFSEIKQLLNTLERSKKEQQQNNNLILTLRHQNDTTMTALREENKNALNSFSEKNNTTLTELKQQNMNLATTVTDNVNKVLNSLNNNSDNLLKEIKSQLESLKDELRASEAEKFVPETPTKTPNLDEANIEASDDSLSEKYNKLKESFKETTTTLLRKEKVLIDSLKKTVLECHTYKMQLEELKNSTPNADDNAGVTKSSLKCSCKDMVKRDSDSKVKNCWCRFKNFTNLRRALSRKAMLLESQVLDSMEKPKVKRRTRQSENLE
ncbi:hypothetical protein TpMuguga_04g00440 [Theileria parva strain Muguga]|uniref:Uncharacterized protein n=1 Tax=Theileria parva TaxID=5875 RepID=Q4N2B2_THEPA|nr:uncharacterized protein TpMuguga_04g00440 [Theileria parva strain Muguga]EAN31792.1 hypothetical protein TpMuguga_04g00440 [Theileria parva strain Muguga]|eukprot:XP_764075.1 hypothetical protein [Theileria parva strain Muguga]